MRRLLGNFRLGGVRSWGLFFILAVSALISGCAGGGSGGCIGVATPSDLTYQTDWNLFFGQSQVVQLLTESGTVLQSRIINRDVSSFAFNTTNSGLYRMRVELRNAPNGGGTVLGRIEAAFEICGKTKFVSHTSGSPTSMKVVPASFTLVQGNTQRFYAAPVDTFGQYYFTPNAAVNWSVEGSGATIDSTGLLSANSPGNVTVRATDVSTSVIGEAPVTVQPFTPTHSKWTILIYMNAANDLYPFSTLNVNQMEKVANNSQVRYVVQWKQSRTLFPGSTFDGTRRMLVKPDSTDAINSQIIQNLGGTVDMGDWSSLRDFISWGKSTFPSDRIGLVIWNHGNGWRRGLEPPTRAVSYDDETGNAIQIWELQQALQGGGLDFVAWDASLMQMMEVAYEIRNQTDYVIGSEESPPGEGYPYDAAFGPFRTNPDAPTVTLTKSFVDAMVNNPPYASRKITQSVLDTSKLDGVATALDTLAVELIATGGTLNPVIQAARSGSQSYSPTSQRTYRDLWGVCEIIRTGSGVPPSVVTAATAVQSAITQAVVWEGHNANSPGSHGLAIDFSSSALFGPIAPDYGHLELAQNTHWDNWLLVSP